MVTAIFALTWPGTRIYAVHQTGRSSFCLWCMKAMCGAGCIAFCASHHAELMHVTVHITPVMMHHDCQLGPMHKLTCPAIPQQVCVPYVAAWEMRHDQSMVILANPYSGQTHSDTEPTVALWVLPVVIIHLQVHIWAQCCDRVEPGICVSC